MKKEESALDGLWAEYARTRSSELRDRLFLHNLELIHQEVGRMLVHVPSSVEKGDLESAAAAGLLGAVERYEPSTGVPFAAFALKRIRGAIVDELRKMDLLGRDTRQRLVRIRRVEQELKAKGVEPEGEEIARLAGISHEEYLNVERAYHASRLGRMGPEESDEDGLPAAAALEDETPAEQAEKADLVNKVLEELSRREQLLVTLHYYEGLTLREISRVMGLSEGRISQMHAEMVARLRRRL
ncbi:MAG TPA: sigma-70 family RNA polymerase sigma factor [Planctomycetes bacterium]|nr:sigma-70 family RNA polymerase sigma factor [Planctomycetota bacterium]